MKGNELGADFSQKLMTANEEVLPPNLMQKEFRVDYRFINFTDQMWPSTRAFISGITQQPASYAITRDRTLT